MHPYLLPSSLLFLLSTLAYINFHPERWPLRYLVLPGPITHLNSFSSCETVFPQVENCEDILMDREQGIAILSCDQNRREWNTVMGPLKNSSGRGELFLYSYTTAPTTLLPIQLVGYPSNKSFHPLGIELSDHRLYVVNHGSEHSSIEIFSLVLSPVPQAVYLQTLQSHAFLRSPNAITAVSPCQLLVTNDHTFTRRLSSFLAVLETTLLPLGWVTSVNTCTGSETPQYSVAIDHISFANGIVHTPFGIFIASSSSGGVVHYSHDYTFKSFIPTEFLPDNIDYDPKSGVITVAGHVSLAQLKRVAYDSSPGWKVKSPSAVAVLEPLVGGGWKSRLIFRDDGGVFSSSSTGAQDVSRGKLLVSGLYEKGIRHCTV